jgi:hypothetical protein
MKPQKRYYKIDFPCDNENMKKSAYCQWKEFDKKVESLKTAIRETPLWWKILLVAWFIIMLKITLVKY